MSKSSSIGKMVLESSGKLEGDFKDAVVEILVVGEEKILERNFNEIKIESQV